MRNMSFALTTPQILARTKTVTRRTGWTFLKPGDRIRAVKKAMGLKKGEKIEQLAVLEVVDVRRQPLNALLDKSGWAIAEITREGFEDMLPQEFVGFFCQSHARCQPDHLVTRIEFRYVDEYVDEVLPEALRGWR